MLEFVVTLDLFQKYPTADEGQLSCCRHDIVNNETLAECSKFLELDKFFLHHSSVFTYEGPRLAKARADLFESLLGAVYIDNGLAECTRVSTLD